MNVRGNETTPTTYTASPVAQAFYAALEVTSSSKSNDKRRVSALVQQRQTTLGWRNRHSQSEYYPLPLNVCNGNTEEEDTTITIHVRQVQRGECEHTYGTGATVWPAARVLIAYLQRHVATLIQNKVVLDLGSGTGLTTVAAALLGARHVTCTDGMETVVQLARENIAAAAREWRLSSSAKGCELPNNDREEEEDKDGNDEVVYINNCSIETQFYWWGTPNALRSRILPTDELVFDVILVSDCVLPKLYPMEPLVEALDQLLSHTDSRAILSYEHRYYPDFDPRVRFCELCGPKQLQCTVVPREAMDPTYAAADDIELWQVMRRRRKPHVEESY